MQSVIMPRCTFPNEFNVTPYFGDNENCTGTEIDENWILFSPKESCPMTEQLNKTHIGSFFNIIRYYCL